MKVLRQCLQDWGMSLCGFFLLAGCGSVSPTHFYQLSSLPYLSTEEGQALVEKHDVVGIGPVDIPSYVDRTQLVIRAGETKLERLEFDRWAEPLSHNLMRVLVENVSQLLSRRRVTVLGWDDGLSLDYRIRIEFTQFDFTKTGNVSLVARWIISGKDSQETLAIKTSRFTSSGIPGDYSSLVLEMSGHVESLSREIANALTSHL